MSNQQENESGDGSNDASTTSSSETVNATQVSSTYKVLGKIDAPTGTGVLGHNTATSGTAHGVEGVTDSPDGYGLLTPDDAKIDGATIADASNVSSPTADGTFRTNDSIHMDFDGSNKFKRLYFSDTTGEIFYNPDFNGKAIIGFDAMDQIDILNSARLNATGTVDVGGDATIGGSLSVGNTSLVVYQSNNQTISGGRTRTRVEFDTIVADHFGGWNGTDFRYDVQEPGDYHVHCHISWSTLFTSEDLTELWVTRNGVDTIRTNSRSFPTMTGTKTFTGLSTGDTIAADVAQSSSSSQDLNGGEPDTFLNITKIG